MSASSTSNFAQAQQRIAARRQARERQQRVRVASRPGAEQVARLPFPLNRAGSSALSVWELLSSREGTRPAFRVGQVDAELLDDELVDLLRGQVGEALKYFSPSLKDDWSAEILLALRAVLFKLSVWDNDATYGAALQNLQYSDARRGGAALSPPTRVQKILYGLVTVGGRYGWDKWENWLIDQDNGYDPPTPLVRRLASLTSKLTSAHSVAAFVSFLVFLLHGRYRTLLDRILGLRLVPPTSQVSREVSFEYLNRQLVWHAFTEFLLFVLPLVGINRWRRWLSRAWKKTKEIVYTGGGGADGDGGQKKGEYAFLPERTCAICYQDQNTVTSETEALAAAASSGVVGSAQTDITNPYETIPCGCIYCFVCLATRLEREEGEGWTCLRCGGLVKECKPWSGDVLEEVAKSPSSSPKHVGFAVDVKDTLHGDREDGFDETQAPKQTRADDRNNDNDDDDDDSEHTNSEIYEEEEDGVGDDFEA